jgi:arylsulfatase A-like enzyme
MGAVRNVLFIMCDQLRADYLSCMGHRTLQTPHIDALAAEGVTFDRAYVQSPICGPSRMSFYTGRYTFTHGSTWNGVPLSVAEWTIGDYLRPLGVRTALAGKTHMAADREGMARLKIDPVSELGVPLSECGFDPFVRDDGLHPTGFEDPDLAYNAYLRDLGYNDENPWQDLANSGEGPDGEILNGWHMRHSSQAARVPEEHSETAWMTNQAMQFIEQAGDDPWCLHLSYIKPHWPYIVPAPYHDMYGPDDVQAAHRDPSERENPHPVYDALIDDHIGRLTAFLKEQGRLDDTLIVFTSDHGDYLGDHWLGEKDLFHEESVRIPLIVRDPDAAADATRGQRETRLVEAIDLLPTFYEMLGGSEPINHRVEGRSLVPLLRGGDADGWRDAVFSEMDYAFREPRLYLDLPPDAARIFMVRTDDWKYVIYEGFEPQLFDLKADPDEFVDLGAGPDHEDVRREMHERLFTWMRHLRTRTTVSDARVAGAAGHVKEKGILIGVW